MIYPSREEGKDGEEKVLNHRKEKGLSAEDNKALYTQH